MYFLFKNIKKIYILGTNGIIPHTNPLVIAADSSLHISFLTPLMFAIPLPYNDSLEISRLLLTHGADVNARNNQNITILHLAVYAKTNSTTLIKLLIDHGADVNAVDNRNFTALDYAMMAQNLHMMRVLIERGANISLTYCMFFCYY